MMSNVLQGLRDMIAGGEKPDAMLYLSARMRDAEIDSKEHMKRVVATERAAMCIISRFDGDGSLTREFQQEIENQMRHL